MQLPRCVVDLQMTTLVQENKKRQSGQEKQELGEGGGGVSRKHKEAGKHWEFSEVGGEAFVECDRRRQTNLNPVLQ